MPSVVVSMMEEINSHSDNNNFGKETLYNIFTQHLWSSGMHLQRHPLQSRLYSGSFRYHTYHVAESSHWGPGMGCGMRYRLYRARGSVAANSKRDL